MMSLCLKKRRCFTIMKNGICKTLLKTEIGGMRYEKKDLLCFVFYNIYYSVF